MKRIVLSGPESTGKSTLAKQLSETLGCAWVREYARTYLAQLNRPYVQDDLLEMAKGQIEAESLAMKTSNQLICDTDLLTIKVWSEFKYGNCDPWIVHELKNNLPDLYLICYPDLKWEYDPQRENPNDGMELFQIYVSEVEHLNIPYVIIKGEGLERIKNGELAVKKIIS